MVNGGLNVVMLENQEVIKMGFGSFLLDSAKGAIDNAAKKVDNINRLKAEYSSYDDSKLKSLYNTSSGDKRHAIAYILKDRGYGGSK